jgi:cytochrome c
MNRLDLAVLSLVAGCMLAAAAARADPERPDPGAVVSAADLEAGEEAFESCASCHAYLPGEPAMIGPNLRGVVGREIASAPDFEYSAALRALGGRWDRERLDEFLRSPKTYAPGTLMDSSGVRDDRERAAIIAFLETLDATD